MQPQAKSKKTNNPQKALAIVYKSKYGATKKYAKWLKQAIENIGNMGNVANVENIENPQTSAQKENTEKANAKNESAKKHEMQKNIKNTKNSPIHFTNCINCDIYEAEDFSAQTLNPYQIIIFAGALYSGELSIGATLKGFLASQKTTTNITTKTQTTTKSMQKSKNTSQTPKISPHFPQIYCLIIGLSSPKNAPNYQKALDKNLTKDEQQGIRFYFLQGGIDFDSLDSDDRARMEAYRAMLRARADKSPEQEALLKNQKLDFAHKDALKPIIDEIINAK
ncbi:hypothetical protein [Helicobacter sp. T3_23-1056]